MSEPSTEDAARVAVRLGGDYVLRCLRMLGELSGGETMTGLISLAIVQANVGHLDSREGSGLYRDSHDLPPDHTRRPVSVLSISSSLGLPYETTRRHVEKMIRSGHVERVRGGIVVPARALDTPRHRELLAEHLVSVRRLARSLASAGVDLS